MGFSETTSFHEVKKAMVQYNPAYRNQAKPRSSQKPKSRETSLARIKPSPAVVRVQQLNVFVVQKPEGTRAWQFPSTPIKSGCTSEPPSCRSEHKWARQTQDCVGFHSSFASHWQSCSLSLSQTCNLSPEVLQQSCPEPWGQDFPPELSMLVFLWLRIF